MATQKRRFRFTRDTLDRLQPGPSRQYFQDDKEPRLWVTVQPSGKVTFHCRCTVDGQTKRIGIPNGTYPGMTIDTARTAALAIANQVATGVDPVAKRRADRADRELARITVEDAVDAFCKGKVRRLTGGQKVALKESTQADYRKKIRALLGDGLYASPLVKLNETTIAKCVARTPKVTGAAGCRSLSSVWNWTAKQKQYRDKLPPNPVREYSHYNDGLYVAPPRNGRLRWEDFPAFLDALEAQPAPRREAVLWLLLTGNRIGEASRLDWQDVDFKRAEYVLRDPKNRHTPTLPIPSTLVKPLRLRRKESGPVFANIRGAVEECARAAGVKLTPHDLRRTHSGLCAASVPEVSGKRLQNRALTDVYHQYVGSSANLHDELAKVERLFYQMAGKPLTNVTHLAAVP